MEKRREAAENMNKMKAQTSKLISELSILKSIYQEDFFLKTAPRVFQKSSFEIFLHPQRIIHQNQILVNAKVEIEIPFNYPEENLRIKFIKRRNLTENQTGYILSLAYQRLSYLQEKGFCKQILFEVVQTMV